MEALLRDGRQRVRSELRHLELIMRETHIDLQHIIDQTDPTNEARHKEYLTICLKRMKMLEIEVQMHLNAIERQYLKEKSNVLNE